MSVVNVENYLVTSPTSINIGEFTLEKDLMSAVNVGSLLAKAPVSFNTRRYTPDNGLMSDVMFSQIHMLKPVFLCDSIRR